MKNVQAILAGIPGFGQARLCERLEGGVASRSFVVEREGRRYVLRVDTSETARLGLHRSAEKAVCEAIAAAGLGSPPIYFDANRGVYLRHFIPGRAWTAADLADTNNLRRLARLLRRVHAVPLAGKPFEPLGAAERYAAAVGSAQADSLLSGLREAHARLKPSVPVLCHNDLVAQNVLESDVLMLIDWEFAGTGDAFFDLAVVVQHHELEDRLVEAFLGAYLDRSVTAADCRRLDAQRAFYRLLLNLWTLRVTPAGQSGCGQKQALARPGD